MNAYERVMAAIAFETPDRPAVGPEIIQHALEIAGATHSAYSTDPAVMAESQLACQRYYGYDSVYISSDNYVLCEAMGAQVRFPADEPPQLLRHASPDGSIEHLSPVGSESGRIPVILGATRHCRKTLGDTVFVKTNIDSAPFSAAASVRGAQDFMMDLYDDEAGTRRLLDFCTEAVIAYGCAAAQAGAHGLAFGDSVAGLLSRDMYASFALPYAKAAVEALQSATGLPVFYHVCGNTSHILDLLMETGADCVELDSSVSMAEAKKQANGKCTLVGNVSTISTLLEGTPQDVRREADAILSLFGGGGGLILAAACEVPRHTPRENMAALISAAKEYKP